MGIARESDRPGIVRGAGVRPALLRAPDYPSPLDGQRSLQLENNHGPALQLATGGRSGKPRSNWWSTRRRRTLDRWGLRLRCPLRVFRNAAPERDMSAGGRPENRPRKNVKIESVRALSATARRQLNRAAACPWSRFLRVVDCPPVQQEDACEHECDQPE